MNDEAKPSYEKQYEGYSWIKVVPYKVNEDLTHEEQLRFLEQHHKAETLFLIGEVRRLAKCLDALLEMSNEV